jgi:hypothetical protein
MGTGFFSLHVVFLAHNSEADIGLITEQTTGKRNAKTSWTLRRDVRITTKVVVEKKEGPMRRTLTSIMIVFTVFGPFVTDRKMSDVDPAHLPVELVIPQFDSSAARRLQIHTAWRNGYDRDIESQNKYNDHIVRALREWNKLDPRIFKSIIAQESGFSERRRNRHGYTGIAQLGRSEARYAGLVVRSGCDQRYTPYYAIPAAAKTLRRKALHLDQMAFDRYGKPHGDEYWRFIAAAYNAGEGTIVKAMFYAYGNKRPVQVKFSDLTRSSTGRIQDTPLFRAIPSRWRHCYKYREISDYADDVVGRARQS